MDEYKADILYLTPEQYEALAQHAVMVIGDSLASGEGGCQARNRDDLFAEMSYWADRILEQDETGALHIFVADGNCDDDSREACRSDPRLTDAERDFLDGIEAALSEEAIHGAWALAQLPNHTPSQ